MSDTESMELPVPSAKCEDSRACVGIVVEDAPSGIRAGVAAGSRVLAVCTSHTRAQLEGHGATWIVDDLRE